MLSQMQQRTTRLAGDGGSRRQRDRKYASWQVTRALQMRCTPGVVWKRDVLVESEEKHGERGDGMAADEWRYWAPAAAAHPREPGQNGELARSTRVSLAGVSQRPCVASLRYLRAVATGCASYSRR